METALSDVANTGSDEAAAFDVTMEEEEDSIIFEELAFAFPNLSLEKKLPLSAGGGVGVGFLDGGAVGEDTGGEDEDGFGEGITD